MLAADADLEVRTGAAAAFDADLDELADGTLVDGLERVGIKDLVAEVVAHEGANVVAREAERHLGEVVGSE